MFYLLLPAKVKTAQVASRKQPQSKQTQELVEKRISGMLPLSILKAQLKVLSSPKYFINMAIDSCGLSR